MLFPFEGYCAVSAEAALPHHGTARLLQAGEPARQAGKLGLFTMAGIE